jgi:hypothetical protein
MLRILRIWLLVLSLIGAVGFAVADELPVPDAGGPYFVHPNVPFHLDGSASYDPDADPITFAWDYDNDGMFDDLVGVAPEVTFTTPAIYTIGLRVTSWPPGTFPVERDAYTLVWVGYRPVTTPEPASILLVATGLGGIIGVGRRRWRT